VPRWVSVAGLVVLGLAAPCIRAFGHDVDEDLAEPLEWLYALVVLALAVALVISAGIANVRGLNPHTGLRSKVRRRGRRGQQRPRGKDV